MSFHKLLGGKFKEIFVNEGKRKKVPNLKTSNKTWLRKKKKKKEEVVAKVEALEQLHLYL